jgi:hypothetical protein
MNGSFKSDFYDHKLYFVPDVCHMLKLARNALGDLKELRDGDNNLIKWAHIKLLHEIQNDEGLKFANKLANGHIHLLQT